MRQAIDLTHEHGAVFVLDEMITGFKTAWPGSIAKYGLQPDMATWGKGIANGFAFCALTGTKEVMELGGIRATGQEKVFLISTTHGAETHAMAAVLATIDEFGRHNVVAHNHSVGRAVVARCREIVAAAGLSAAIEVLPCEWMVTFLFRNGQGELCPGMRTLMMQEMIARGVLFQGIFVPCLAHSRSDIDRFVDAFRGSLAVYNQALVEGYARHLVGPAAKPVFRKYL